MTVNVASHQISFWSLRCKQMVQVGAIGCLRPNDPEKSLADAVCSCESLVDKELYPESSLDTKADSSWVLAAAAALTPEVFGFAPSWEVALTCTTDMGKEGLVLDTAAAAAGPEASLAELSDTTGEKLVSPLLATAAACCRPAFEGDSDSSSSLINPFTLLVEDGAKISVMLRPTNSSISYRKTRSARSLQKVISPSEPITKTTSGKRDKILE
mmetsp:Transcript_13570/g.28059  ORF Transcript_13570/g.28059 Transcript_13570/m.28059 type:complete len:213 (-) Transcript_13570:838-1476(-)